MPLAVEEADAVAVEDVEHVGVVSREAGRRSRRRRRRWGRIHHRRSAEELHGGLEVGRSRRDSGFGTGGKLEGTNFHFRPFLKFI